MATLTLHHLDTSRSHRILWLLEELELHYDVVAYDRDPKTMRAPPELRAVHPLGKAPVLTVGDDVLAESGAVIEAVVDRFGDGRLRPAEGTPERERYRYWLHYAEGSLMPPLLVKLITSRLRSAPVPFFVKPLLRRVASQVDRTFTDPEIALHAAWLERSLTEHPWFAGEAFTAADIQMSFPVETALVRGTLGDQVPHVRAWVERLRSRPAYQRAVSRGGDPVTGR